MTPQQIERLPHVPPMYRGIFERVYEGQPGHALQVHAKCLDCCCYQRIDVKLCPATACPLWAIRPYQQADFETSSPPGDKVAAESPGASQNDLPLPNS